VDIKKEVVRRTVELLQGQQESLRWELSKNKGKMAGLIEAQSVTKRQIAFLGGILKDLGQKKDGY
jgi:hypothetical protein